MSSRTYINKKILLGIGILVVVVLSGSSARGATEYECWGGCYNKCIILQGDRVPTSTTYPCYYNCLTTCPRLSSSSSSSPTINVNYYCQLGCAADLCNTLTILDNGNLKKCIGRCTNICQPN